MPVDDVLERLDEVEGSLEDPGLREELREGRALLSKVPGSEYIRKYTGQDMVEAAIGSAVFSLPLLVEDGVFDIASWLLSVTVGPVPVFFVVNALATVSLTGFLLYATDIREVRVSKPLLGFLPRRFVGVLVISFSVAAGMMYIWGRLHDGAPTGLEQVARVTVVWAAGAMGAVLADILPGESRGRDISEVMD